ncbi:hypothetical protein AKJ16_DCAP13236 [Drosera capensis]
MSCRFSCLSREYKYFFLENNLDISAMEIAGKKFLGENNFRNCCKMDALNVHNCKQRVISFEITRVDRFKGKELRASSTRDGHQLKLRDEKLLMFLLMERATEPSYEERRSKLNSGSMVPQRLLSLSLETKLN